ncbi:MAG: MATE family efflux transporter [Spirochaetales bacterium]|nr:MATE family efflux transporter [Spirochaetales bacterium]
MRQKSQADLLNEPVQRLIYKQTIPVMLAGLLSTSYMFIDMFFASRLGGVQVASIAFVTPIFVMLQALATGLSRGGVSIIAKLIGQDKKDEACAYATQLRLIVLYLALFFSVTGIFVTPFLLTLLGIDGELHAQALIYTQILFFSVPFSLANRLYMALFKSQGKMNITSRITLLGVVGNTLLNTLALFVFKLGIDGLAYASVLTRIIQALVVVTLFHKSHQDFEIKWSSSSEFSKRKIWIRLFKVGLPLSFSQASLHFGNLLINMIIVPYGYQVVAAFAIGNRINSLMFFPSKEIGQALVPLIAQNWGKRAMARVREAIRRGIVFSVVFGVLAAFVLQAIKFPLGRFLTKGDALTYRHVLNYVGIAGWTVIAWAIFHTLQAIFNSFQRTSFTLISNMVRLWGIRIPGILLFRYFLPSLEEYGVWYTMFISNSLTLVFAVVYFAIKVPPLLGNEGKADTIDSLTPLPATE